MSDDGCFANRANDAIKAKTMEFRLTYQGILPADTTRSGQVQRARAKDKHAIRKVFHPQLKELWNRTKFLKETGPLTTAGIQSGCKTWQEFLASEYAEFGYNFVPLIVESLELACEIEILCLWNDNRGSPVHKGDIDNRIKMLLDALRKPRQKNELGDYAPDPHENPFFVLLENDSLITKLAVETDQLLEPVSNPPDPNDARIIIKVRIKLTHVHMENLSFV